MLSPLVTHAQPGETHLGQPVVEHVQLAWAVDPASHCRSGIGPELDSDRVPGSFYRLNTNGIRSRVPFVVPTAKIFVITDVFWRLTASESGSLRTESLAYARLQTRQSNGDFLGLIFYTSPVAINADNDRAGAGGHDQILGGIRVAANAVLCGMAINDIRNQHFEYEASFMQINGYLVKAPTTTIGRP